MVYDHYTPHPYIKQTFIIDTYDYQSYYRSKRKNEMADNSTNSNIDIDYLKNTMSNRSIGMNIIHLDSVDSTMAKAKSESESGAIEGTVILAEEQTRGRGRFDRTWLSPKGSNLLFSVILRPTTKQLNQINMAATLSVANSVSKLLNIPTSIKWPNDVHVFGKKISGILIESVIENSIVKYAIIGIGLNVNWNPPKEANLPYPTTSLALESNKNIDRTFVLQLVLEEMNSLYSRISDGESLLKEWSNLLNTIGKSIIMKTGEDTLKGIAQSVDENGNLKILKEDGSTVSISSGEIIV